MMRGGLFAVAAHVHVLLLVLLVSLSYSPNTLVSALSSGGSSKVLIIQNKGGGHGTIGYYLSKAIKEKSPSSEVVILQDKCNYNKLPFSAYGELASLGVRVIDADVASADPAVMGDFTADYIVDNWSKSEGNAAFVADITKKQAVKQLLFVSSAGMYDSGYTAPHIETDPVKESNGARKVEATYMDCGIPYTFLRPQYIYGEKSDKRYLDYFIGRATRQLPIPLPLSADQLVCLTHCEDVAGLIESAIGHSAALNEVFNCGTDRYISYQGLCQLVHREVGSQEQDRGYLYFDPKLYGSVQFPFRRETFVTSPGKAKRLLQWAPKHTLEGDMGVEVADYKGGPDSGREWRMEDLRADLEILASKDSEFMFTYPFFDDKVINTEKQPYPFELQ